MPVRRIIFVGAFIATCACSAPSSPGELVLPAARDVQGAGPQALLTDGLVWIDQGTGCVRVDGRPMVWPAGASLVRGEATTIRLADGTEVRDGDRIQSSGGYISIGTVPLVDGGEDALRACRTPDEAWHLGPQIEVIGRVE